MDSINFKTTLNIQSAGNGCSIRLGDIDSDGRMEFVFVRPAQAFDPRYFDPKVLSITAFSLDGELLWQVGDTQSAVGKFEGDIPVQIYDIDRDGKNEVIAVIEDSLIIFDGKTGDVKKQILIPDQNIGGALLIADLEGSGYPQNIILKNKHSRLWALDANLNVLWDFEGNIGLSPVSYDINGDGREEIIAGYCVLSSSGELLWKMDYPAHAVSAAVECLYKEDEPVVIIYGEIIRAYSKDGEMLWEITEKASNIAIGSFRENIAGVDLLVLDNLSLFDSHGEFMYQKNETIYLATPVTGFDKSGKIYIAGHKKEDICTTLYDGYMRPAYTLPGFGKLASCDLLGDGNTQVLVYNDEILDIYSFEETDYTAPARPYSRPQPKQYYNTSVYNSLPHSRETQGYVLEDFASHNIVKWATGYAQTNMYNRFAKVSRSEFVLLLATLLNLKEEFLENFADVSKEDTYYDAVGTFKSLGILECANNLFSPEAPITVLEANGILDKLSIPINFNFDAKYELSKQDMARLILNITDSNM